MSRHVTASVRAVVADRAKHCCEYCLIPESASFFGCEVEHVIAIKHGGPSDLDNLAWACAPCNRFKGSDIASVLPGTTKIVPLSNPRVARWANHFAFDNVTWEIHPTSESAIVTIRLLQLNSITRLLERHALANVGAFPPSGE